MAKPKPKKDCNDDLKSRWNHLNNKKSSISALAYEYARWTLPYLFPSTSEGQVTDSTELQLSMDSIGAQAVNHLSNKVVMTLFPPQSMFFRLSIDAKAKSELAATVAKAGGNADAVAKSLSKLDTELANKEKEAGEQLDMVAFRPQAVRSAQLLIITGNALEYHPKGLPVQVYSLRDYCVVRDLSGEVIEIMTREAKAFETFKPEIQQQINSHKASAAKQYEDQTDVVVYTRVVLEDDGRYHVYQAADECKLDTAGAMWTKKTLPWIVLTWNLVRGEDYGRGLVGDYSGAFHAVNTLSQALLNIAAIMGDIKFLVKPQSMIDVVEMNKSPPGSYHSGNPEDVTTVKLDRYNEAQFIQSMIERYERQIGAAFLLMSTVTRQAERVTAEEIRRDANELETSNGGIYSRLAFTWQSPLAYVVLDHIGLGEIMGEHGITPRVVTGLDSLSRTSELDNIHMWMADMALLDQLPEDTRAIIDQAAYAEICGTNRQVDYKRLLKTEDQINQENAQRMQAQAQMQQNQASANVASEAGKAAIKEAA